MTPKIHQIAPADTVAVVLQNLAPGDDARPGLTAAEAIPAGHKIALRDMAKGEKVLKYGWPIGVAAHDIKAGAHVHSHNLVTALSGELSYVYAPVAAKVTPISTKTFMGYRRANGRVGTRNEIWILSTVACVARTAQRVAAAASELYKGQVDGVYAFTHPFGCSQLGDDLNNTRRIMAGLAAHPNAGGVLIIGLGCESNKLDVLASAVEGVAPERLRTMSAQESGDEFDTAMRHVEALVAVAARDKREASPLSDLVIGVKCGGSDGLSGVTANPLVGCVADAVAGAGGTPILTEIPEIFGAEHLLMQRAASRAVFDGIVDVTNGFKRYFIDHGQPVHENPSPGNIAGGITTLEEKSLGAVQKAGHATVTQVLKYGAQAKDHGLALLEAPGNDSVSSTALTAAGATVILFTTGRGTPLGFPAPTLKIATNSDLAVRKPKWVDFNAGRIVEGQPMDDAAAELLSLVIDTASGQQTRAEQNGEREIALWKTGVTL
ncbi:MAG: altronate dehydratase [Rhodospirillaceae bacterium]|nr:altronate dehydratase [Rhodospirillaceae bacterium]